MVDLTSQLEQKQRNLKGKKAYKGTYPEEQLVSYYCHEFYGSLISNHEQATLQPLFKQYYDQLVGHASVPIGQVIPSPKQLSPFSTEVTLTPESKQVAQKIIDFHKLLWLAETLAKEGREVTKQDFYKAFAKKLKNSDVIKASHKYFRALDGKANFVDNFVKQQNRRYGVGFFTSVAACVATYKFLLIPCIGAGWVAGGIVLAMGLLMAAALEYLLYRRRKNVPKHERQVDNTYDTRKAKFDKAINSCKTELNAVIDGHSATAGNLDIQTSTVTTIVSAGRPGTVVPVVDKGELEVEDGLVVGPQAKDTDQMRRAYLRKVGITSGPGGGYSY